MKESEALHLRILNKPDGRRHLEIKEFADHFFVSPKLVHKLVQFEIIKYLGDSQKIHKMDVQLFYNTIFPIKDSNNYKSLTRLLNLDKKKTTVHISPESESSAGDYDKIIWKDEFYTTQREEKRDRKFYVGVGKISYLTPEQDYKPIDDGSEQNKDAFKVRHVEYSGDAKGDRIRINPEDLTRVYLAKTFLAESTFRNQFEEEGLSGYDRQEVLNALRVVGVLPILYKGKFRFAPGSADIALDILTSQQRDNEKDKRLRELVGEHGLYITAPKIRDLVKDLKLTQYQKLLESGTISSICDHQTKLYNLVQVTQHFELK